jgi:hypothetical protein
MVLEGGIISLSFRRNFGREKMLELEELERDLEQISLSHREILYSGLCLPMINFQLHLYIGIVPFLE